MEAIAESQGVWEAVPNPDDLPHEELLDLCADLLGRGWIEAGANQRGDGRLFSIRNVKATLVGRHGLEEMRRTSVQQSRSEHPLSIEEKRRPAHALHDSLVRHD